jgi:hypothetical protein
MVAQILENGKMVINFEYKDTMENFIFVMLKTVFSTATGIIDVLARILKVFLGLEFEADEIIRIFKVYNKMPEGKLKAKLKERVVNDKDFDDFRNIRKLCEHADHTQIFTWSDSDRKEAICSRPSGIPKIRKDLAKNTNADFERQVNMYCELVYSKLYNFLRDYLTLLLSFDSE